MAMVTPPDGLPSMKKAVIRYTEENYNRLVAPENVIITNGAKQSLYNIFYSILNPHRNFCEIIVVCIPLRHFYFVADFASC